MAAAIAGCSKSAEFPVAAASGEVLCDGKPVPTARVVFGPIAQKGKQDAGRSAFADVGEDGKFVLSTYGDADGAVVGTHKVSVSGPHPEEHPEFDCNCETDGRKVLQKVEVKADGKNVFTINLPPRTAKSRPSVSQDDLEDIVNSGE
jgi:hypothetical protein